MTTQPIPPKIKSAPSPGIFAAVVLVAVFVGASAVIFFFNPSRYGFYPVCQFHRLTGLNCPGCGATRAFYALLHGKFLLALKDNALFVGSIFGGMIWSGVFAIQKWREPETFFYLSPKLLWSFLAVAIVFSILRNLPAFSFLSP
jgi:hypothetical protein